VADHTPSNDVVLRGLAIDLWHYADPVDAANEAEALQRANCDGQRGLEALRDAPDSSRRMMTLCRAALRVAAPERCVIIDELVTLEAGRASTALGQGPHETQA
jgi:hypothetical protein